MIIVVFNHEIWRKCANCGADIDMRQYLTFCPDCGQVLVLVIPSELEF
jgi:predicted RNA-binding Zn-ribbon protein involved in translation (DUF1610 family)